ncbi:ABC transporter permease [Enterococcus sp. AZ163]|uniref:ABC transporter permease n=1 Tax=Enterococcus sp. AZ163 TaxID=2774638 RepID=UPI003D27E81A
MSKPIKGFHSLLFFLIGLCVFILPLFTLFKMAFEAEGSLNLQNFNAVFHSVRTVGAIKNTLIIAVASTIISGLFGGIMAVIVAYTNIQMKRLIETMVILPYLIPGYVVTLSWTSLFSANGPINHLLLELSLSKINMYSIGGIIFVMGLSNAALVYLNLVDILRKIPREQEWASLISGYSVKATLRNINLRSVLSPIISGIVLAFLSSIDNFAIPVTLGSSAGIQVLSTYIYEKAIGFGPNSFNEAAVLSIILASLSFVTLFIQWLLLRRTKSLETASLNHEPRILLSEGKRKALQFGLLLLLFCINIVPLIFMMLSSFHSGYVKSIFDISHMSLKNYRFILTAPSMYQGFITSFTITIAAIILCVLLGVWVMHYKQRINAKATLPIELGASLTYSTPGIVLALSMIFYWNQVPNVYGTLKILLIAYVTRYALLLLRGSNTAFLAVDSELEEAALVSGSNHWEKWRRILLPMIKHQLFASSFLMFVGAFTELTLSSLLAAAGTKTVGLTIFNLQTSGDNSLAQAYSVIVTLFILVILSIRSSLEKKGRVTND